MGGWVGGGGRRSESCCKGDREKDDDEEEGVLLVLFSITDSRRRSFLLHSKVLDAASSFSNLSVKSTRKSTTHPHENQQ